MLKKLFSHTAIYGLAPQITKVANFFALPIITQDLTEVDFGVSGVLTAYTTAISVFAALGLRVILVNSFFKSPGQYKWLWRQLYGFLNLWNFIYAGILGVLIYLIIPEVAEENKWTILLLNIGPLIFFGQTYTICSTYFQLNQKPTQIALRSTIFGFLTIGLNVLLISYYKMGYMGWFWSTFIAGMLSNLSYYYPLNFIFNIRPIYNFKRRLVRNSLKVSLPMVPHYYSSYLLDNSDRMIMDVLNVSTGAIGKYNVAYTIGRFMNSLGTAGGLAIGPLVTKMYKNKRDVEARNLIFILQICFFLITTSLCIWMKEIFSFLIRNESLSEMYYLGVIIVMAYNYRPMYLGFSTKIMFWERTNVMWKITFGAGFVNVIFNIILISWYGFEVAAFTTFFAYMIMGYAGYFFIQFKEINNVSYFPLFWFCLTIGLAIFAFYAVEFPYWLKGAFTLGAALLSIYFILKFNKIIDEF